MRRKVLQKLMSGKMIKH